VRLFALTYPQLIGQGRSLGYGSTELARVRAGYDFAEVMADGLYRPHGEPLITHLVRTASIAAAEGLPVPAVVAAMNHAAYELHKFTDSRRSPESHEHRDDVRVALGTDAEALVWAYHVTPWYGSAADYASRASELDEQTRQVLAIRLANALEDHLDQSMLFTEPRGKPLEVDERAVALAQALDRDQLAHELDEVFRAHVDQPPDALARPYGLTYELPSKHLWER
jgi:hypothetical protein